MKRLLPIAVLSLLIAARAEAAPPQNQERQCWLDSLSDAQKRALVQGYVGVQRTEGKARADAWAQQQRVTWSRKFEADGTCPPSRAARTRAPSREPQQEARIRNRYGKPCKRIELENQNVPNIGGAMGWAPDPRLQGLKRAVSSPGSDASRRTAMPPAAPAHQSRRRPLI